VTKIFTLVVSRLQRFSHKTLTEVLEGFTFDKNPKASSLYYLLSLLCFCL